MLYSPLRTGRNFTRTPSAHSRWRSLMSERIRARVAEVLTERELVLNKGSEDGVSIGMRFAILNRKGADIVDPDTGKSMGPVELEKTIVKVVRLQERLAIARTFRTYRQGGSGFYFPGILGT